MISTLSLTRKDGVFYSGHTAIIALDGHKSALKRIQRDKDRQVITSSRHCYIINFVTVFELQPKALCVE